MSSIHTLIPTVQHYPWGGYHYIPSLLGKENHRQRPFAELWMGAHPKGPARVQLDQENVFLSDWLTAAPEERLGPGVVSRFGPVLPFLFKVLDVREMLSIQAHPSKQQAETGYEKENMSGIPADAPSRNFKDDNHKPEVMVALSDFWLLHGFRPADEIAKILHSTPEFRELEAAFQPDDLRHFYGGLMGMPQSRVDEVLHPLRARLLKQEHTLEKAHPDFWAARAFRSFDSPEGHSDRGIFSIYLLNLVHLRAGEGIFQAAGIPHAYLEGINVELMANSDNVFRGGLTHKHIDVPGLLQVLNFDPVTPEVLNGHPLSPTETVFPTPAPDFQLSRIRLEDRRVHASLAGPGPEILINLEGEYLLNNERPVRQGTCLFIPFGTRYQLSTRSEALLFKAAMPEMKTPQ